MKKLTAVIIGLMAAGVWSVSSARAEINIAVAGPMTGQYATFGEQMKNGAEMAVTLLIAFVPDIALFLPRLVMGGM